jgi:hypothetical protein
MADSTIAIYRLQSFQIALHFAPKIAFDRNLVVGNRVDDLVDLLRGQIPSPQVRIDIRLLKYSLRRRRPDTIDVGQRGFDPFLRRNFNSE